MGKTTLLEAFSSERPAARVAVARTSKEAGMPPLWPWVQIFERLEIAAGEMLAPDQVPDAPDDPTARFRLFARLERGLAGRAARGRLCLGLEDLHWWDRSSLELLGFLLASGSVDALLIGTVRPDEMPKWPWPSMARVRSLRLHGLSAEDVERLVRRVQPHVSTDHARRLTCRTGGNPYFVLELSQRRGGPDEPLPAGLEALLDHRLAHCGEAERRLLSLMALHGRPIRDAALAELVEADAPAVRVLEREGLIRRIDDSLTVSHPLLAERAAQGRSPEERRELHARLLRFVEQAPTGDPAVTAALALRHAVGSAKGARDAGVFERACAATEHAERRHAHAEVARFLQIAVDTAPPERLRGEPGVAMFLRLARARIWAGDRLDAERTLAEAWQLAERSSEPRLLAEVALGRGLVMYSGRTNTGEREDREWMERALERLPNDAHDLRAQLLSHLAMIAFWTDEHEGAGALLDRARAEEPIGRPARLLRTLAEFTVSQLDPDGERALREATRLLSSAQQARRRDVELAARLLQVTATLTCGAAGTLDRAVDECEALMEAVRHPLRGGMLPVAMAQLRAPLAELERRVEAYVAQLAETANPNAAGLTFLHRFFVARSSGGLRALRSTVHEGRRRHPRTIFWQVASILIADDDPEGAAGRANQLNALFAEPDLERPRILRLPSLCLLAQDAATHLSVTQAERLLRNPSAPCGAPRGVRLSGRLPRSRVGRAGSSRASRRAFAGGAHPCAGGAASDRSAARLATTGRGVDRPRRVPR